MIKKIFTKYKELILYAIFGGGATLINVASFYLLYHILHMHLLVANVLAWLFAFVFAFITNKIWVFESKEWKSQTTIKETLEFLFARLTTLLVDSVLMWLFIDIITMNELISKIFVNIIVIVINYFASKFWIFRKNQNK